VCTQTETCYGTCINAPTTTPTATECIVGAFPDVCSGVGVCSQTMSCGGLCVTTAVSGITGRGLPTTGVTATSTSSAEPLVSCVLGGAAVCGSGEVCYQTETCSGVCVAAAATGSVG